MDAAPDGKVVCDAHGTIVLVNKQGEQMFGYAREELVGQPVDLLVPLDVRGRHHQHVASFVGTPRLRPMRSGLELHGRRKDGSEFPIEISLSPIETERGLLVTASIRDVTDRRRLQHELKRAHAYLSSSIEATHDAFVMYDEHDRLVMVNSAARGLSASDDGPTIGETFEAAVRAAIDRGAFDLGTGTKDDLVARWLAYHRDATGTFEVRTGTGRYLRVTTRRTSEQGRVSILADVTDDVLRAEELRRARVAAEAASAAKTDFLSSMSHELRTPLNAILGFAQLLERDRKSPLDERQLERLGHVLHGGEHLLRLIDDILDLARIEARRVSISPEPVELGALINEVVTTLWPMAVQARIALVAPVLPAVPSIVLADRTRLAQILMNFGSNAIKYGKPGGRAELRVEDRGKTLGVAVIDDGIGIAADKLDKIFEPFQRAGQEAGPIEGTGIGLTISKRLAELMGGSVGFRSDLGRGSEFWIELPRADDAADAAGASPLAAGAAHHEIVYIDDNPSNVAFMRAVLDELADVELVTAPSVEIGLPIVRARLPAAVIMDADRDALAQLRDWPETRAIPVITLSKPVKVAELTATLEELLTASRRSP